MKYTDQLKAMYNWEKSELYSLESIISQDIKNRFLDRSSRRYHKLNSSELGMLLFIMHRWGFNLKDMLEYFESSTDFHKIANDQSVLPNQFSDISYILSCKYHSITEPSSPVHSIYKDTTPEKLEQTFLNAVRCLEIFNIMCPVAMDHVLKLMDTKTDHSNQIGVYDPISIKSVTQGYDTVMNLGYEKGGYGDRNNFYLFEEILLRQMEFDLIDLNSSSRLVHLDETMLSNNSKIQVYQNISSILEHEPSIVGVSIYPENLATLLSSLADEIKIGFLRESTIKSLSIQLLSCLSEDTFDEHLSDLADIQGRDGISRLEEVHAFFDLSAKKYNLPENLAKIIDEKINLSPS